MYTLIASVLSATLELLRLYLSGFQYQTIEEWGFMCLLSVYRLGSYITSHVHLTDHMFPKYLALPSGIGFTEVKPGVPFGSVRQIYLTDWFGEYLRVSDFSDVSFESYSGSGLSEASESENDRYSEISRSDSVVSATEEYWASKGVELSGTSDGDVHVVELTDASDRLCYDAGSKATCDFRARRGVTVRSTVLPPNIMEVNAVVPTDARYSALSDAVVSATCDYRAKPGVAVSWSLQDTFPREVNDYYPDELTSQSRDRDTDGHAISSNDMVPGMRLVIRFMQGCLDHTLTEDDLD